MKLTKRMMRILKLLEDGEWREINGCFNEVLALNPLVEFYYIECKHVGGMGADWSEYRILQKGMKELKG